MIALLIVLMILVVALTAAVFVLNKRLKKHIYESANNFGGYVAGLQNLRTRIDGLFNNLATAFENIAALEKRICDLESYIAHAEDKDEQQSEDASDEPDDASEPAPASKREQFAELRKTLSIKEAAEKLGIAYSTARRYEKKRKESM